MKALSVRQPWADAIASGDKWVEFRSRPTNYRGDLVICASRGGTRYAVEIGGEDRELPTGVMLCVVKLIDSRPTTSEDDDQPGYDGNYGYHSWVFDDYIDILIPRPVKGMVNFFEIPDKEIELAPEGKFWFDYL